MKKLAAIILMLAVLISSHVVFSQGNKENEYKDSNGYIFKYTDAADGIKIVKCINNGNDNLIIPKVIDGKRVTELGNNIFDEGFTSMTVEADIKEYPEMVVNDNKSLKKLVLNDGLEKLGDGDFYNCSNLSEVVLPDSLVEIGNGAFDECVKLNNVKIPDSVDIIGHTAFMDCLSLSDIEWDMTASECGPYFATGTPWLFEYSKDHEWLVINNGDYLVSYIGSGNSVIIPNASKMNDGICADNSKIISVTADCPISENMFARCTNLKSAVINTPEIGKNAFKDCTSLSEVELSNDMTVISSGTFSGCTALKSISLPKNLEVIGGNAFNSCGLTEISFPDSLTAINDEAFMHCENLSGVKLPEGLTKLGARAFRYCYSITGVNIPYGVEDNIGKEAFSHCKSLKDIKTNKVTSGLYNATAFTPWREMYESSSDIEFLIVNNELKKYNGKDKNPAIPDGVKIISARAFAYSDIETVNIPSSVEEIQASAFYSSGIKKLTIPETVKYIRSFAFGGCESLASLVIRGGTVEAAAFADCSALKKENIKISEAANVSKTAFAADLTGALTESEPKQNAVPQSLIEPTQLPTATVVPKQAGTIDVRSGDTIEVEVRNKSVVFPDAQPYIDENGRTKIPIRAVAEGLGCEVDWDDATRTAVIKRGNDVIYITIGKDTLQVGNKTVQMDTTAEIKDERTYIPVRFVGEALGMEVNWVE